MAKTLNASSGLEWFELTNPERSRDCSVCLLPFDDGAAGCLRLDAGDRSGHFRYLLLCRFCSGEALAAIAARAAKYG